MLAFVVEREEHTKDAALRSFHFDLGEILLRRVLSRQLVSEQNAQSGSPWIRWNRTDNEHVRSLRTQVWSDFLRNCTLGGTLSTMVEPLVQWQCRAILKRTRCAPTCYCCWNHHNDKDAEDLEAGEADTYYRRSVRLATWRKTLKLKMLKASTRHIISRGG